MIKKKKGTCVDCPPSTSTTFIYASNRCQKHYWTWRDQVNKAEALKKFSSETLVNQNSNQNNSEKLHKNEKLHDKTLIYNDLQLLVDQIDENRVNSLQDWFLFHIQIPFPICENCGDPLIYSSSDMAFSCQAHILPKSLFPSIKTNINNHLYLCGMYHNRYCHSQFDSTWARAEEMPVFNLAVEKFILFKNHISKSEYSKLRKTPFYKYL